MSEVALAIDNQSLFLFGRESNSTPGRLALYRVSLAPTVWSPDSRYVLNSRYSLLCHFDVGPVVLVDVAMGKQQILRSSHSKWLAGQVFWIASSTAAALASRALQNSKQG